MSKQPRGKDRGKTTRMQTGNCKRWAWVHSAQPLSYHLEGWEPHALPSKLAVQETTHLESIRPSRVVAVGSVNAGAGLPRMSASTSTVLPKPICRQHWEGCLQIAAAADMQS